MTMTADHLPSHAADSGVCAAVSGLDRSEGQRAERTGPNSAWKDLAQRRGCSKLTSLHILFAWRASSGGLEPIAPDSVSSKFEGDPGRSAAMASAWSSASTGKPQVSYAERLRRAKEGAAKRDEKNASDQASMQLVDTKSDSYPANHDTIGRGGRSNDSTADAAPFVSVNAPDRSNSHDPSTASRSPTIYGRETAGTPTTVASATAKSASSTTSPTRFNVWEARKKQLDSRINQTSSQNNTELTRDDGSSTSGAVHRSSQSAVSTDRSSKSYSRADEDAERRREPVTNPLTDKEWLLKVNILNGANSEHPIDRSAPTTERHEFDRTLAHNAGSEEAAKVNDGAADGVSSVERSERIKTQKKRLNAPTNDATPPPPFSDALNWPSPNTANDRSGRAPLSASEAETETGLHRRRASVDRREEQESLQSPQASRTTGLDGLDVEVLRQPGLEKGRKGKQWIPIVPTITHFAGQNRQQKHSKPTSSIGKRQGSKDIVNRRSASNPESRDPRSRLRRDEKGSTAMDVRSAERSAKDTAQREPLDDTVRAAQSTEDTLEGAAAELNLSASTPNSPNGPSNGSGRALENGVGGTSRRHKSNYGYTTARGYRGKQLAKRAEMSQLHAQSPAESASQNDSATIPGHPAKYESRGELDSERDTYEATKQSRERSPLNAPLGPKAGNSSRTSRSSMSRGKTTHYNGRALAGYAGPYGAATYGPAYVPSPFMPSYQAQPASLPFHPFGVPVVESTPAEFAPTGTSTSSEPTFALLLQVEFYFSHQNLQGDFFLRKSMDVQGFVPIEVVASFNRVKHLAGENVDLIRETLQYSKALQLSDDKSKVRKAYGWEPYVLVGGEHAQHYHAYPVGSNGIAPPFGTPPPPIFSPPLQPRGMQMAASRPYFYSPYPTAPYEFVPSAQHTLRSHPATASGSNPNHTSEGLNPSQADEGDASPESNDGDAASSSVTGAEASQQSSKAYGTDSTEDGDDDEISFGVVASTGLGGTLGTGK